MTENFDFKNLSPAQARGLYDFEVTFSSEEGHRVLAQLRIILGANSSSFEGSDPSYALGRLSAYNEIENRVRASLAYRSEQARRIETNVRLAEPTG